MDKINKKIKHLKRRLGFREEELTEIKKMYEGAFFDPEDTGYQKLLRISKALCEEYSALTGQMGASPSLFRKLKNFFRKMKILDLLFPVHGFLSSVGEGLQVVIGLVDFHGCGYTNRTVKFSPYTLVECEKYTIFATKIQVGSAHPERQGKLIRLNKTHFGDNCWICAGVQVDGGVDIGARAVVGAGAHVTQDVESDTLAVGRPCRPVRKISEREEQKSNPPISPERRQEALSRLKKLGYKRIPKEYLKMLDGEYFNSTNLRLGSMFLHTHKLCSEFNRPETPQKRKDEILNILFPDHGKNLTVGGDLYVDMLGMTKIGDDVSIGSSVYMSGPVTIESGAKIGNGVLMFGTGHSLVAKERRVGFSLTKGLYEYSQSRPIAVKAGVCIGDDAVIVPGSIVCEDAPKGALVTRKKTVKHTL